MRNLFISAAIECIERCRAKKNGSSKEENAAIIFLLEEEGTLLPVSRK